MHEMLGRLSVGWTFLVIVAVLVAFSASAAQAVTPAPTVGADRLIPPFGLPSWTLQGDAHITDKFVRIAEDRQHKKGALWNLTPNPHENWEATWTFRIHGVSQQGADGLAFWYVDRPNQPGTLFGSAEHFNGIAVVIDTYDNDGTGLHPYVMLLKNDGTKVYMQDHEHGSHKESQGTELDGCTMHIRNLATPSSVKVTYMNHMLKVDVSVEDTPWQKCIDLGPLDLPSGFHFGFSAATGDLADNHDLYSFSYHGLDDSGNEIPSPTRSQPGLSSPIAGISSAEIKSAVAAAVGPGLAQLQTEVSRLKQEINTLSERVVASEGRKPDNRPSDKEAHIVSQVDRVSQTVQEVKQSIEKTEHGLKSKLNQLETALASAGNGEEETGGSWLSWLTYLIVIATCVALFFFQYSAYRRRKQKFF